MKLKSLKLSKADREKQMPSAAPAADAPQYPWGASLSLDNESLEKLGIAKLPAVGEELLLVAKVKVTSVSAHDSQSGKSRSLSLQMTDACLEAETEKSAADALYESAKG